MVSYGQDPAEQCLIALERMEFQKALLHANKIEDPVIGKMARNLTAYYVKNDSIELSFLAIDINDFRSNKERIIYNLLSAQLMNEQKEVRFDSKIVQSLFDQRHQAASIDEPELSKIALRWHLLKTIYSNNVLHIIEKKLSDYEALATTRSDYFWLYYLKTGYEYRKAGDLIKRNKITKDSLRTYKYKEINQLLNAMHANANNSIQCGYYYHNYASYQGYWQQDYKGSNNSLQNAIFFYKTDGSAHTKERIASIEYNTATNLKNKGRYQEALTIYLKDLKRKKPLKQRKFHLDNIIACYDSLKDYKNVAYYQKQKADLEEGQAIYKQDSLELAMQGKFNIELLSEEKEELSEKTKILQGQIHTILPLLVIVIVILILVFYLFKRYQKKSTILEEEKSETLQKLDELKGIVIKNHVVLKDKTKVYIANLMYIKSEDHYLKIFTSDGKNRFVRGKLSQIKEELPPNFIQCHRSYIVNRNFIKQFNKNSLLLLDKTSIPVSRSYKDRFR